MVRGHTAGGGNTGHTMQRYVRNSLHSHDTRKLRRVLGRKDHLGRQVGRHSRNVFRDVFKDVFKPHHTQLSALLH